MVRGRMQELVRTKKWNMVLSATSSPEQSTASHMRECVM